MQKAIWPILKELFVIGLIELIRLSCGMLVSSDRLVKVQGCSKYGYGHSSWILKKLFMSSELLTKVGMLVYR